MISRKDIFVGARIMNSDPENPTVNFTGTVQSITPIGEREYDYMAAVLPDEEFRQLPGIENNSYFGLTMCCSFGISLLTAQIVAQDPPHIMQKFRINLQLHDNDVQVFYNELIPLLVAYGYEIDANNEAYSAPEARKSRKRIYCHPLQLAGECPPSEFKQIEEMLRCGETYEIKNIKLSDLMFDYTEAEELEQYHLQYDDGIQTMLLDAFRTENPDEYKNRYQIIETLSKKIKIITIYNYSWSGDGSASTEYVKAAYNILLKKAKISINPADTFFSRTVESFE